MKSSFHKHHTWRHQGEKEITTDMVQYNRWMSILMCHHGAAWGTSKRTDGYSIEADFSAARKKCTQTSPTAYSTKWSKIGDCTTWVTIYDLLSALHLKYEQWLAAVLNASRARKRGMRVHCEEDSWQYGGEDHTPNAYVSQELTVASTFSHRPIRAFEEVCNMKCADEIVNDQTVNKLDFRKFVKSIS